MGQHRHSRELFFATIVARDFVPDMSGSRGFRSASFAPSFVGSKLASPRHLFRCHWFCAVGPDPSFGMASLPCPVISSVG